MKKITSLLIILCSIITLSANAQVSKSQVENAINTCNSLIDAHNWQGAFATLRSTDAAIGTGNPELHYLVAKQRFVMYSRINRGVEAKANIDAMESLATASGDKAVIEDMLLTKAGYNSKIGNSQVSHQCYKQFFALRSKGKDDAGMEECYKSVIAEAKQNKYYAMADIIQRMYNAWQDSIAGERSASELRNLKAKYAEAQESIDDKDTTITGQWATIILLAVIVLALAAALAFFILTMLRNVRTIKKLRTSLDIANKSNEQKSVFIRNISGQIAPSLDQIARGNSKQHVPALQQMLQHAETYMSLESSREEKYEVESANVAKICEEIAANVSIPVTTDATNMSFPVNKEAVVSLLNNVIKEISANYSIERITVGFKKRNSHTGHFFITAIGMKIAEEDREGMFTAFSKIHDLTVTDGLTLPTCALMAYKMGGQLFLEEGFAKGTRFVLEIHC